MWGTLGLIQYELKNYDAALPYLNKSLISFKTKGNKAEAAELWNALGKVYFLKNNLDSALHCYMKAKELAEPTGHSNYTRIAYEGLSEVYGEKKDFENAYDYLRKYLTAQNKFLDSLNIRKVTELNAKYESVSRQRKIDLLEKDKEIQHAKSEQEKIIRYSLIAGSFFLVLFLAITYYRYKQRKLLSEKLSASLSELKQTQQQLIETEKLREQEKIRLRISRDIHDEIGSSLTKIALLSEMATEEVLVKPAETKETLHNIADYSRSVNSSLSEIVWAVNPQQDTLHRLLAFMRSYTHTFLKDTGINFKIDFPETTADQLLHPDLKRNVFLVLKESLNNAVKYSKAKNILIYFIMKEKQFELSVKDDGIGLNGEKSFSGNGLNNMKFRMEQSNCEFKIISSPGKGCEINAFGNIG
jgi:signal transduction histidine kinase